MKRQFNVVIERDSEGWLLASVPSLKGCHTQAKSFDELENRIREAIESRGLPDWLLYVYFLNPLAGLVGGFRWALLGEPLDVSCLMLSVSVGCVLLVVGAFYFRKIERRFADIV